MIDIDEEIKKFKPIPEPKDIEENIYNKDIRDVKDYIQESVNKVRNSQEV